MIDVRVLGGAVRRLAETDFELACSLLTWIDQHKKYLEQEAEKEGVAGGFRLSLQSADEDVDYYGNGRKGA